MITEVRVKHDVKEKKDVGPFAIAAFIFSLLSSVVLTGALMNQKEKIKILNKLIREKEKSSDPEFKRKVNSIINRIKSGSLNNTLLLKETMEKELGR